ncbi:Endoplasmic reticulum mannosyl-oligosaccharide 1,2-alpha-mannosidase [Madurella mycetomatis]|uniref:alpha-1,2-Mannosidase n=1 Tax=Madurella mycetomatis TaxID=100816 RepID=A0A175VP08_9PEZI|nr:Endoplasmic reticulum mannosyl-oligosaccharide 1,2-alpha-mannosidase [Madurella mycetomatis]
MSQRRRNRRILLIAITALATLLYYYHLNPGSSFQHGPANRALESARLARQMNANSHRTSSLASTSSFDWGSLPLRHPPPPPVRQLPLSRPVPLPPVQHLFLDPEPPAAAKAREARRQQVKALFLKTWTSYRRYAWGHDALQPLTGNPKADNFAGGGGWATTLVDALDTLWIMGLRSEFDEAVAAVARIDFGAPVITADDDGDTEYYHYPRINMFEVNIRLLGGLLGAYDLSGRQVLLTKAIELGELLYRGFDTANRMPVDFLDLGQVRQEGTAEGEDWLGLVPEPSVVSASPGTLGLEMTRLAQITGDWKFFDAVERVMEVFEKGQAETRIPGLWPVYVSMERMDVVNGTTFGVSGGADSLYEYLPKMYALLGGVEVRYDAMSRAWMETANKTLFFRPMLPDEEDVLMVGAADAHALDAEPSIVDEYQIELSPESEHLGCFLGGVYALAGKLFRRPEWVDDLGAKLTKGCVYAYKSMPTGIMPERYNMVPCKSRSRCPWDEALFDQEKEKRPEWAPHLPKGFTTAKDPRYLLRPEAIESVFIMYRITGRQEYQEAAWDMFLAISNATATPYANAAVLDVTKAEYPLPQEDYMESFWLAETLKYFYLIFSPPDLISLDDYVLNTEAHPFRKPTSTKIPRPS